MRCTLGLLLVTLFFFELTIEIHPYSTLILYKWGSNPHPLWVEIKGVGCTTRPNDMDCGLNIRFFFNEWSEYRFDVTYFVI